MGCKRQGIWSLISQLKNLATIDVDAKIFSHQLHRNPGLIPQTKGIVPYLNTNINLLNSHDPHQTLRELLQKLHHVPAFPWPIRHHLTFHDPPINLIQLLEVVGKQGA
ncbi:hypothetical protein Taro_045862 [Colocasia esculenta]|uniref:Uncharacterized protein n=1 Tax=Colocasia esculenta TaxID=4460 RepID=A0A843X3D0_COLES|nr:hypothetical protein [Colocasia esculenta]